MTTNDKVDIQVREQGDTPLGRLASSQQVGGNHYKGFAIQPAEFSEKNKLTFLEGDIVKRICRHSRGGKGVEDLQKCIHEIRLLAEFQYGVQL